MASPRIVALVTVAALAATACGGGGAATRPDPGPRPDLPVAAASANSPFADVTVRDLTGDRWVQLADYLPADKPVLVWFWAPH